jgi:hypothetical protein
MCVCAYVYAYIHTSQVAARSQGVGMRPLACWDSGFQFRQGQWCLYLVIVVYCQAEVTASGRSPVQRSPNKCGVPECDREASIMSPWPTRVCCAMEKNIYIGIETRLQLVGPEFGTWHGKELFIFFQTFRPVLKPTHPSIQWVPGSFLGSKMAAAWCWPLTYIHRRRQGWEELHICSPYTPSWRGQAQLYL